MCINRIRTPPAAAFLSGNRQICNVVSLEVFLASVAATGNRIYEYLLKATAHSSMS
eukprot:m.38410 g.38410  ORF g.38410 m.38410 type:complete len:56 (+) comp14622_c0_seq7:1895-2062(+)